MLTRIDPDGTIHSTKPLAADLLQELGALRHDRDLLIRKVLAIYDGLEDGTATVHWRDLLRTARWMERCDRKRAEEEAGT